MTASLDNSKTVTLTHFRQNLEAIILAVELTGESVIVTRYGKPFLVVTRPDLYQEMVAQQRLSSATIHPDWPAHYFETTAGLISDPTFKRQPQGDYQEREPLDD